MGRYIVADDGAATIELNEDLQPPAPHLTQDGDEEFEFPLIGPQEYEILHGQAGHMALTAYRIDVTSATMQLGAAVRRERLRPLIVVEAYEFLGIDELVCMQARFEPRMASSMAWSKVDRSWGGSSEAGHAVTVTTTTMPEQSFELEIGSVTVDQFARVREMSKSSEAISILKALAFTLTLPEPRSLLDVANEWIRPLCLFLNLIDARPVRIMKFHFKSPTVLWPDENNPSNADIPPQQMWTTVRMRVGASKAYNPDKRKVSFVPLEELVWDSALPAWFSWFNSGAAEAQLMTLLLDPQYAWLESQFITAAQLVEGLHRKSYPAPEADIQKNQEFINRIVAALQGESFTSKDRNKVKSALKYRYEPSLEGRIVQLDAVSGHPLDRATRGRVKPLATAIAKLRNAFAHSSEARKVEELRPVQVARAALLLLGFSFLLTRAGLTDETACRYVEQSQFGSTWLWLVTNHSEFLLEDNA